MNDLMSLGVHRLWKRFALSLTGLTARPMRTGCRRRHRRSGDRHAAPGGQGRPGRPVGHQSAHARDRPRPAARCGAACGNVQCLVADAERLPFADDSFDCVTIGFGLRNVTDKAAALRLHVPRLEARRTASGAGIFDAGGSGPQTAVRRLFVQRIAAPGPAGRATTPPAIGIWPNPFACTRIKTRCSRCCADAGFAQARYHNLTGGIVALHRGYKI